MAAPGNEMGSEEPSVRDPEKHRRIHDLLDFILERGTEKDIEWITGNLENFGEAIRSRSGKPARHSKVS
jgi:hypothetical protein